MNINKIKSIDDLREYMGTILLADELTFAIDAVEDEFLRGLVWVRSTKFPMSQIIHIMHTEGDGVYNRTLNNNQFRITVKDGIPKVMIAQRTTTGTAVCPGWFGRIKRSLKMQGMSHCDRKFDKLFVGLNQFAKHLKSQ